MEVQGGKRKVLSVLSVGCMLAFGVLYVGQVNSAATKGYAIRALKEQNSALRQERDLLDIRIAKLRSIDSVTIRQSFLGLQKIQRVTFVSSESNIVAVR